MKNLGEDSSPYDRGTSNIMRLATKYYGRGYQIVQEWMTNITKLDTKCHGTGNQILWDWKQTIKRQHLILWDLTPNIMGL